jgi:cobalt-zinc-cadmium efflux system membrane fusion protein
MQINKKLKILFTYSAIAIFVVACGLFAIQGLPPKEAQAQKNIGEKDNVEHDHEEHNGDHDEDRGKHSSEDGNKDSEHATHAEENEDGHGEEGHAEDDEDGHAEDDEDGHAEDDEDGHAEDEEEDTNRLSEAEQKEFGVILNKAQAASLEQYVDLPGEIVLNADQVAHVVPRVAGIIREVKKKQGDHVRKGEVMAIIESRDLADAKAEFLATRERNELAQLNFTREERLWQKKITSEQEYLDARQVKVEARIALRSAEQKLHALGFTDDYLKALPEQPDITFTRYEIKAPFGGRVIQKHISLGEVLEENAEAFVIADLNTVWVDLQIYQKDLVTIRKGQGVAIQVGHGVPDARGVVDFVGPLLGEETRTALARVVLENKGGDYRPGMFVTARVAVAKTPVSIAVEKTALQNIEGQTVVFVKTAEGFEPQPIEIGRRNTVNVEVISGLNPGDVYVSEGAFTLKAQLSKGAFGDGHNH